MAAQSSKPDPKMSPREFAAYAQGLLDTLGGMALRFKLPLLAHLIDLAAREAEHTAKLPDEKN